jgi:hypothetical protein
MTIEIKKKRQYRRSNLDFMLYQYENCRQTISKNASLETPKRNESPLSHIFIHDPSIQPTRGNYFVPFIDVRTPDRQKSDRWQYSILPKKIEKHRNESIRPLSYFHSRSIQPTARGNYFVPFIDIRTPDRQKSDRWQYSILPKKIENWRTGMKAI